MLLTLALSLIHAQDPTPRTHVIYRFPAKEIAAKKLDDLIENEAYDTYCIEPRAPASLLPKLKAGRVKVYAGAPIDTSENLRWRNDTIAFTNGKISPKEWWRRAQASRATVHFLSNPKTPELRAACRNDSGASVMAIMLLVQWPGTPCLTSGDAWETRELPDTGPLQSWVLAVHDWLGPALYMRADSPQIATGRAKLEFADSKPGMLHYSIAGKTKNLHFFFNNSDKPLQLRNVDWGHLVMSRGIYVDDNNEKILWLAGHGSTVEERPVH